MKSNFQRTADWLTAAGKAPTKDDVSCQMGVHLEEIKEMLDEITLVSMTGISSAALQEVAAVLDAIAKNLKAGHVKIVVYDKVAFLDSLCDQSVTVDGLAFLSGFDKDGADADVLASNESKLNEDGTAVILPGGKIGKNPERYLAPYLVPFVGTSEALNDIV